MMEFTGQVKEISRDWNADKFQITFTVNESSASSEFDKIKDCEKLTVKVSKYRHHKSTSANGLLWKCLGEMAQAFQPPIDKWELYLMMLKKYGKYSCVAIQPQAVEDMKNHWRECEIVGKRTVNGQEVVYMLCYYGSSTYDTKEFSVLLDGVISDMVEMGLQPPSSAEMQRVLEEWEKKHEKTV